MGYLWASTADDAASYIRRSQDLPGNRAAAFWRQRLKQAKKDQMSPLDALRRWVGEPEHEEGGHIPADANEKEAVSLEALEEIVRR